MITWTWQKLRRWLLSDWPLGNLSLEAWWDPEQGHSSCVGPLRCLQPWPRVHVGGIVLVCAGHPVQTKGVQNPLPLTRWEYRLSARSGTLSLSLSLSGVLGRAQAPKHPLFIYCLEELRWKILRFLSLRQPLSNLWTVYPRKFSFPITQVSLGINYGVEFNSLWGQLFKIFLLFFFSFISSVTFKII